MIHSDYLKEKSIEPLLAIDQFLMQWEIEKKKCKQGKNAFYLKHVHSFDEGVAKEMIFWYIIL